MTFAVDGRRKAYLNSLFFVKFPVSTLQLFLYRNARSPSCSPRIPNQLTECLSSECKENESLIILWQTATNALSACVNNPQNST
jgi:hypothetical protein